MKIKGIVDEDFVNYKLPSMYISTSVCDFKCDRESGLSCCQNSSLAHTKTIEVDDAFIIERYLQNPITHAIVFGGLEPFDQFEEMHEFLVKLRNQYHCNDTVVIYTGYNKTEISSMISELIPLGNIVMKFGRFVPGQGKHYDEALGISLASDNQFAEVIC